MTGQDIQDRLDAIVTDLQTNFKGSQVDVMLRGDDGAALTFTLSSDANGIVDVAQHGAIQDFINLLKPTADDYETRRGVYTPFLDAFKTAQEPHKPLMDAAAAARVALQSALDADAGYQTAKTNLEAARTDIAYVESVQTYSAKCVSENFGNLQEARGKYRPAGGGEIA